MERRRVSGSMDEYWVEGGKGSKKSSGRHDQLFAENRSRDGPFTLGGGRSASAFRRLIRLGGRGIKH